jgi:hypothetical protein
LIKDITKIENYNLKFTLPYVLLISAGIDFLGGLICGFEHNNSRERSVEFIEKWMGKVNLLYREKQMADFLYDSVRSGATHYAMYKKYASCSGNPNTYPPEKHLHVHIRANNDNRIIIQVFQFIKDFIKAYNLFKENYIKINYEDAYKKLKDMLKDGKNFENLIKNLKQKNKIYYSKIESEMQADSSSPSIRIGTSASPSEADFDKYF